MRIIKLAIRNFRNLDNVEVVLDESCNFIVGENNLGKSNLLTLLRILFDGRGFQYDDFDDPNLGIEVQIQLSLIEEEIGHFQDLFDATDYTKINLVAKQPGPDEYPSFYHLESDTFINRTTIKSLNFVYYDSLRNPNEVNFDKGRGVGRFLKKIIAKYLEDEKLTENEFINENKLDGLLNALNEKIKKIKTFNEFGISAEQDSDIESLLSKIIVLEDAEGISFSKAGYGIQYLILITLSILEKIQMIIEQRGDKGIFEGEEGEKSISIVLGLDEPEIHLHPYMQRSLIKYLDAIIKNQNSDFQGLVKELFDIDKLIGQLIIVTHSPNMILNNYKQIVRLFRENEVTRVVSGSQIILDFQQNKHLLMQFTHFKEAFFSRCAIFVEGETEFSCLPLFGKTMSIDFDDFGISVIQARGAAVGILMAISDKFKIQCVGVSDNDGTDTPLHAHHKLTTARDFEAELLTLIDSGREAVLRQILTKYDSIGVNRTFGPDALNNYGHRAYGLGATPYASPLKLADIEAASVVNMKAFYVTWLCVNKGYPLGFTIGSTLALTDIPTIFQTIITEAKTLAQHA